MSIYTVRFSEWFPIGHELHALTRDMVSGSRCYACNKKPRWKAAIGYHSMPYGCGWEVWCSIKCRKSGKIAKCDKRRERRLNRRYDFTLIRLDTPEMQDIFEKCDLIFPSGEPK